MNGKGDKARPLSVSRDEYESRFDAIFRKRDDPVKPHETLYADSTHPFAEWLKQCPVEFSEEYTDNYGTRAGYIFWIK